MTFAVLLALALAQDPQVGLSFETLPATETGIRRVMEAWKARELERQGGEFQSHGWWPWGLRAFDYDGDGDLDLLASHHGKPGSLLLKSLLKESGKLTFVNGTAEMGMSSRDFPGADDRPWIWDFDGDGDLDIAGVSDESKAPSLLNEGGKRFRRIEGFSFNPLSHPREVVDLNGDGVPDVDGGYRGQWVYLPEEKRFKRDQDPRYPVPAAVPRDLLEALKERKLKKNNRGFRVDFLTHGVVGYDTRGYSPVAVDLDGDGRGDLVMSGSGGYGADYVGRYFLSTSEGALKDATRSLRLPESGAPILLEDLTGDGRPDVLVAGKETGGVYVHDGRDGYTKKEGDLSEFLKKRGPYLLRAYPADLDNDGDLDLVVSNPRYGREEIHENVGGGEFRRVLRATGWDSNPVVVADVNADGLLDVVIGGPQPSEAKSEFKKVDITVYLNRTRSPGRHVGILPRMDAPNPFAVGAVVEIRDGSRTLRVEKAHPDGTPVHFGLGRRETCDVRIRFPNGKTVERTKLATGKTHEIKPDDEMPYKDDPAVLEALGKLGDRSSLVLPAVKVHAGGLTLHGVDTYGPGQRDYCNKMPYAPDRRTALYAGGNHGVPHRMNDVWEYHLGSNAWHLLYAPDGGNPSKHKAAYFLTSRTLVRDPDKALSEKEKGQIEAYRKWWNENVVLRDGHITTTRGGPIMPAHTWDAFCYDAAAKKLIWGMGANPAAQVSTLSYYSGTPVAELEKKIDPAYSPMWMFDPASKRWIHYRTSGKRAALRGMGATMAYLPDLRKTVWYVAAQNVSPTAFEMWLFDVEGDEWTELKPNGGESISTLATKMKVSPMSEQQTAYSDIDRALVAVLKHDTFLYDFKANEWSKVCSDERVYGHDARSVFVYDRHAGVFLLAFPPGGKGKEMKLAVFSLATRAWEFVEPDGPSIPVIKYGGYMGYYDPRLNGFVVQGRYKDRIWVYRHRN